MTGFPSCSIRLNNAWPRRACARPPTGGWTDSSLMSAPATKDFSPAPVSTTTRTSSRRAASPNTSSSSARVRASSAFNTFGRLIVTTRTAPSCSTSTFSKAITCEVWHTASMKDAVHEPADRIRAEDQPAKHPHGQSDLIASLVAQQRREHGGDASREEAHHSEMRVHVAYRETLRPDARSNASRTTRTLSRPAAIRKVLPYSNAIAVTSPRPHPPTAAA